MKRAPFHNIQDNSGLRAARDHGGPPKPTHPSTSPFENGVRALDKIDGQTWECQTRTSYTVSLAPRPVLIGKRLKQHSPELSSPKRFLFRFLRWLASDCSGGSHLWSSRTPVIEIHIAAAIEWWTQLQLGWQRNGQYHCRSEDRHYGQRRHDGRTARD